MQFPTMVIEASISEKVGIIFNDIECKVIAKLPQDFQTILNSALRVILAE